MEEKNYTPRGFRYYAEFKDTRGSDVRVQKSSSAEQDCVWIFCQSNSGQDDSPHLNVEQAKIVRDALNGFINDYDDDY